MTGIHMKEPIVRLLHGSLAINLFEDYQELWCIVFMDFTLRIKQSKNIPASFRSNISKTSYKRTKVSSKLSIACVIIPKLFGTIFTIL